METKRYHTLGSGPVPAFRIVPNTTNSWSARESALNEVVVAAARNSGLRVDDNSSAIMAWTFDEFASSAPLNTTSYETTRSSGGSSTSYIPTRQGLVPVTTTHSGSSTTVPVSRTSIVNIKHWRLNLQAFDASDPKFRDLYSAQCRIASDRGSLPNAFQFLLMQAFTNFPGNPVQEKSGFVPRID